MLELKNICFERDNKKILDNINLTIDTDKFVVITGPNGSGKSTLAKIIMGIEKPDSGKILLEGQDITKLSIEERAKLGIGFAFQQPVKFKGLTVRDILHLASGKLNNKHNLCKLLSTVGLCGSEYLDRPLDDLLSGGELKRIEIATILAKETSFAIFDEPEAGIDLWSFTNLIDVFEKICKQKYMNMMVISHQERILNIVDKIVLLKNGMIYKYGAKDQVMQYIVPTELKRSCGLRMGGCKNNEVGR